MKLDHPVTDLVRARVSRRRYEPRPIDGEARRAIEAALDETAPPFGTSLRFSLAAATEEDRSALRGLGTYGFIRDAPGFVIGAVEPGRFDMVDFGFAMEEIVLRATDLELGTCWLGGSFTRSTFAEKMGATGSETVPAVIAIGHATTRQSTMERLIRAGAGSKKRRSWESMFFSGSFGVPLSQATAGEVAQPLEMVRLAPSASNKQPWRVIKSRGEAAYHFFVERTPGYGRDAKLLKMSDLQRIDLGIAICHFTLTAHEAGLEGEWVETDHGDVGDLPNHTEYIATWQRG